MPETAFEPQPEKTKRDILNDLEETKETIVRQNGIDIDERPAKRRRVSVAATPSTPTRPKAESPPWKKIVAEGPSSFTQDGKRKSGRFNMIPLELQPPSDKRQTRGAAQKSHSSISKLKQNGARKSLPAASSSETPKTSNSSLKRPSSAGKAELSTMLPPKASKATEANTAPPRSHKKAGGVKSTEVQGGILRRRSARASEATSTPTSHTQAEDRSAQSGSNSKTPRIRFRMRPPSLPVVHPGTIVQRPPKFESLEEFLDKGDVLIEDGGLLALDDEAKITEAMAVEEAKLIMRMEAVAEGQGVLSVGVCSAYRPDDHEWNDRRGPLRQYAHHDHLIRAVTEFRILMVDEHKKHKRNAKRLAEACRDEWHRRQPKTSEEIELEAIRAGESRYKLLIKTLQATWDNVRGEVNRRRVKEWEAEEQIRVRKALNEAVDISTQKLEARRGGQDSEIATDDEESDGKDSDDESDVGSEGSDSHMSASSSEDDEEVPEQEAIGDEQLSVEELRKKYSDLPGPVAIAISNTSEAGSDPQADENAMDLDTSAAAEDSDESVDMDDDMGSSDEDQDSDQSDEGDTDNDEDDELDSTLLGFLPAEDRAGVVSNHQSSTIPESPFEPEVEEDENENEVSLIPDTVIESRNDTPEIETSNRVPKAEESHTTVISQEAMQPTSDLESDVVSVAHSSEPTPNATETKPSETDYATSIELHESSRTGTPNVVNKPESSLKTPVPFLLRGTLREYQHYGLDWLAKLYANKQSGILADEMGLGKTIQTIALLAHLACEHHVWGPHLVIVPTSVMLNWEMEFKKFLPGFKILTYYGTQEERKRKRQGWATEDTWNVVITSYQLVLQDQQVFKRRKWHYMILDEAHNIKNFRSQRWQTMLTFNTRARLLLTGTPLQNNLMELWSLLFFVMPPDGSNEQGMGGFANREEFNNWFKKPEAQILENGRDTMDDEARGIISKLHKIIRPYLLRRMKADVEKQMPAKYEHVEYCRLSRRQRELYDGFLSRSDTRATFASGNYLSISNCLMQLRKVCNHPDLFQERPILSSFPMKRSALADFEIKDLTVRRNLLRTNPMSTASLSFLNLVPTVNERLSLPIADRSAMLTAQRLMMDMREMQRQRAQYALPTMDPSSVKSNLIYLEGAARWSRFEELQHCVYLNALRRQQKPIYGSQLIKMLDFRASTQLTETKPRRRDLLIEWMQKSSDTLRALTQSVEERSIAMQPYVQKFTCTTPPVIAPDALPIVLSRRGLAYFQTAPDREKPDPFHEARMRLSVQFPDKRLLQYDCGKLQALDKLLRRLQSGGHRALIFTQMTKVLDILEQFLNIHGHRYLRLDGSTKIEQRQGMTDRFNNDPRILAFILSSRSGGLGINLTGADTVIFYDLDWNPAMDKQCQDRAHRIGQTRDVHIYRLVSEHTIETNILRKANQKRMLDDVVIQEGEFTTDYFNKKAPAEVVNAELPLSEDDAAANAALDRVLGGPSGSNDATRILSQAEDQEDAAAAKVAQQEISQTDAADFDERAVVPANATGDPQDVRSAAIAAAQSQSGELIESEVNAWGESIGSTDDYMLRIMTMELKYTPLDLPKDRNRIKRGKDHRNRSHRPR